MSYWEILISRSILITNHHLTYQLPYWWTILFGKTWKKIPFLLTKFSVANVQQCVQKKCINNGITLLTTLTLSALFGCSEWSNKDMLLCYTVTGAHPIWFSKQRFFLSIVDSSVYVDQWWIKVWFHVSLSELLIYLSDSLALVIIHYYAIMHVASSAMSMLLLHGYIRALWTVIITIN